MRKLTQQEIDNAPEWATHYTITRPASLPMYESTKSYQVVDNNRRIQPPKGISSHAKPIPRKEFDIVGYEFSDVNFDMCEVDGQEIILYVSTHSDLNQPNSITHDKQDVIALAKHFKLTAEDLK